MFNINNNEEHEVDRELDDEDLPQNVKDCLDDLQRKIFLLKEKVILCGSMLKKPVGDIEEKKVALLFLVKSIEMCDTQEKECNSLTRGMDSNLIRNTFTMCWIECNSAIDVIDEYGPGVDQDLVDQLNRFLER